MALFIFVTTTEKDVCDCFFSCLWEDTWSDQFSRNGLSLGYSWLLIFRFITELDDKTSGDRDSISKWENEELVLANIEYVLDEDVLFLTNLKFWIVETLSELLEIN